MKKLTYLFAGLIMVALIVSCSKDTTNNDDAMLKKAVATGPSNPVSDGEITPYIIPGANNGGNRTCAEVAAWKGPSANYFYCGDKVDYNNGAFASAFPSGLDVTVTAGKYVSFKIDDCIQFGDKLYKVGAVIVKGSNAANVYYYPEGTMEDSGLASPINASGSPAGLSNLTFCFIECEEELIISVKVWYKDQYDVWGASTGTNLFTNGGWCTEGKLGVNSYPGTSYIPIHQAYTDALVGSISVVDGVVTITLNEGLVKKNAYIFIGTEEELLDPDNLVDGCPDYTNEPWRPYIAPSE